MPNWCYNSLTISHDDPAMIARLIKAANNPLQEFIPCPHDPKTSDKWYDWRVNNWSVKWDIELRGITEINANTISCTFDSAWSPPIEAYYRLSEMGFNISAMFREMGMAFAGRFESNDGDIITEEAQVDFENERWRDDMSDELVDFLEYEYQSWLEYMNEKSENV